MIEGVACDLHHPLRTFDDLAAYAYGVASTVGLMTMHIIGFTGRAIPYAIKLGVALQITNILRDVGEDWGAGRVYLPQEELAAFGLSDADITLSAWPVSVAMLADRWRAFMRFQIERNRRLYDEATPGSPGSTPTDGSRSPRRHGCIAISWRPSRRATATSSASVPSREHGPLCRGRAVVAVAAAARASEDGGRVNSGARAIDLGAIERG